VSLLQIDLETPNGWVIANTKIPSHYKVQRVVGELAATLNLPLWSQASGNVSYALRWVKNDLTLDGSQTLADAGVVAGDKLKLVPSVPLSEAELSASTQQLPIESGDASVIEVWLVLPDRAGERIEERVDVNVPSKALLGTLIQKHHLAVVDDFTKDAVLYDLRSKRAGRKLKPDETLKQAGVERLDSLTIVRQVDAG
jgi:hypothetical protein